MGDGLFTSEPAGAIRRITIILNPAAGRGQGARCRAELEHLLRMESESLSVEWGILETPAPGTGTALAARAAALGADLVVAAGGDGTYGEVVNGLVGTGAKLGILPLGTGNDFSRCLGLGTDLKQAVATLFQGMPRWIDLGRVQDRWFINIAGCGFDAVVAERINRGFRYLHGTAAYVAAVYQCLLSFRPAMMRLTLDGETREVRAMLCAIANASSYGGGIQIAPDARIDDGWFDVCLIGEVGKWEFVRVFPRAFKGAHVGHPKVTMLRARHVVIESNPPLPVLADGDISGTTPVEFTLVPHAIEVMTISDVPAR